MLFIAYEVAVSKGFLAHAHDVVSSASFYRFDFLIG
jgi:hypothetical protein